MEDLTGTELEEAETTLFKQAIAESIRSTMWVGDTSAESGANTFDGFLKAHRHLLEQQQGLYLQLRNGRHEHTGQLGRHVRRSLEKCGQTPERPKAEGQLAFFVSSDVLQRLREAPRQHEHGRCLHRLYQRPSKPAVSRHPVVDLRISSYLAKLSSSSPVPKSFCILTDRRNLVLAVNTADFPGNEIRMWYNPDEMERPPARRLPWPAATCSTKDWSHSHRASDHVRNHSPTPGPKACGEASKPSG